MSIDVDGEWHERKLPLWATIRKSYATYFSLFPDVLRASAVWLVIAPILIGAAGWLQWTWIADVIAEAKRTGARTIPEMPIATMLAPHLSYLILNIGLVSIAIAWHRRVIIGERPMIGDVHIATTRFWRYVGIYLAIMLICFLVIAIIVVPSLIGLKFFQNDFPQLLRAVVFICWGVASVFAILILFRFSLLLPARAIDDVSLTFNETWQRTRGNVWRLIWGTLACSVVPIIPIQIAMFAVIGGVGPTGNPEILLARAAIYGATAGFFYILIVPIFISFLSLAYQHFFEEA